MRNLVLSARCEPSGAGIDQYLNGAPRSPGACLAAAAGDPAFAASFEPRTRRPGQRRAVRRRDVDRGRRYGRVPQTPLCCRVNPALRASRARSENRRRVHRAPPRRSRVRRSKANAARGGHGRSARSRRRRRRPWQNARPCAENAALWQSESAHYLSSRLVRNAIRGRVDRDRDRTWGTLPMTPFGPRGSNEGQNELFSRAKMRLCVRRFSRSYLASVPPVMVALPLRYYRFDLWVSGSGRTRP